ncbi:MAG TPA: ATP-binding cassette domain-containing protein, partial [Kiloniellaceae bacterium]|nr:ATP-binding cassette domain-containing protein [Kiloniellaceae bacterium]
SGKSTLGRALTGIWPSASGKVRLDGVPLDQWIAEDLGRDIGYLPQDVELFDGTIAENIARFQEDAKDEDVIEAAKAAGVHELITSFEGGYAARVGDRGTALSGGQRQRIGLARALYGKPFLLVLDEPNANLDGSGEGALNQAILTAKARGAIVIIIAHRPSALATVDYILQLDSGRMVEFGPRDEMIRKLMPAPRVAPKPQAQPAAATQGKPEASAGFVPALQASVTPAAA